MVLPDLINILATHGANLNIAYADNGDGLQTRLLRYRTLGGLTELLVAQGNPDLQNSSGETALMIAAAEGLDIHASLLLNFGASRTLTNIDGQTAWSIAQQAGFDHMLEMLDLNDEPGDDPHAGHGGADSGGRDSDEPGNDENGSGNDDEPGE